MGLPSFINLRVSQVDPTSLIAAPSRAADNPSGGDAFERHLDRSASPAARAADRRDDQRQRDRSRAADDSGTGTASQPASDATASKADDTAENSSACLPLPASETEDAAAPKAADLPVVAAKPEGKEPESVGVAPAVDATATVTAPADETPFVDAPVVKTPVKDVKTSTAAEPDGDADDKKIVTKIDDTVLVALSPTHPAPTHPASQQQATLTTPPSAAAVPATNTPAPADSALAPAGTQAAPDDSVPEQTGANDEPDSDTELAIKPKVEGLGHQAAADMANKTSGQVAAPAQVPNPQAVAATPMAANFVRTAAAAGSAGGGVEAISATTSSDGTLGAQINSLQNTGTSQSANGNSATIRIGTLPGQTTPTVVPAMAIALQIARNVQKGINRFDIRLDPPELGRIDVRMEVQKNGHVAAHLTVEQASTLDLLQRDARSLQQALNEAGLQADADSLSFSLQDQNSGGNTQDLAAGNGGGSPDTGGTDEVAKGPIYNINLSASGGVDIRV